MNANNGKKMKQIVMGVQGKDGRTFWSRIGVAFENADGSWNEMFDAHPTYRRETTIQLRDFDSREEQGDAPAA